MRNLGMAWNEDYGRKIKGVPDREKATRFFPGKFQGSATLVLQNGPGRYPKGGMQGFEDFFHW